ncbi:F-box protein At3g12350-like [Phragmites australis]|uniref:F-box protein At3g12350-like n=1 Tax=Phragmites australis TaxID=29695 RepID=UPI002D77952F|nr:F-box protein At3g12350-like [Phragmites australis]
MPKSQGARAHRDLTSRCHRVDARDPNPRSLIATMGSSPTAAAGSGTALEDLPEDALLSILTLLAPSDAAAATCACRRLAAAASSPALPLALALRLGLPPPPRPLLPPASCPATARRLLRSLHRLRRLLGLWRRLPSVSTSQFPPSPSLAAFEWAPSATLAASLLAPSSAYGGGVEVSKSPFVTLSIAESGDTVAAIGDMPVCVNFVGNNHIVVEAAAVNVEGEEMVSGSPPEEIYAHFANRRSPGAGRRRRGRQGRRGGGMEAEHFVRIADAEPTKARPLQGLWKGICEDRTLEFYLVTYDDIGGVTCQRFSDTRSQNSGYSPVFWTTDTTFLEPPFSEQELDNYSSRNHIRGVDFNHAGIENRVISRILCINSSYDVVEPHLSTPLDDARNVEGRIWLYEDGTFGFGFVGSNSIIDLRNVSSAGCILDTLH